MRCIEAVNELSREVCVNPSTMFRQYARLGAIRTAPDKRAGARDSVSNPRL